MEDIPTLGATRKFFAEQFVIFFKYVFSVIDPALAQNTYVSFQIPNDIHYSNKTNLSEINANIFADHIFNQSDDDNNDDNSDSDDNCKTNDLSLSIDISLITEDIQVEISIFILCTKSKVFSIVGNVCEDKFGLGYHKDYLVPYTSDLLNIGMINATHQEHDLNINCFSNWNEFAYTLRTLFKKID